MSVIDKIHMLKKILKEADNIVAWQGDIYTALHNIDADWVVSGRFGMPRMPDMGLDKIMVGQGAGNSPVEEDKPVVKLKAGSITDTTGADGKISVTFAEAFASVPVVIIQLEGDVDYYCVVTAKNANGFTVKILKTYHKHSQGNTGNEATHTHSISFASGAEAAHTHNLALYSTYTNLGSHSHTQGVTGGPSAAVTVSEYLVEMYTRYCATTSGGSPTFVFEALTARPPAVDVGSETHTHTNPTTNATNLSTHRHYTTGSTGAGSSHTHSVSGTSGAGSGHSHTNPDTSTVNAGNLLAATEVTFSYIAMIP